MAEIIDIHHHYRSPRYIDRHGEDDRRNAPQSAHTLVRRISDSLGEMDRAGVALAILSNPNIWYPGDLEEGRDTARELNEYAALARQQHPGRFGSFAVLPFPDTDGTLEEIEYAFDELAVDGVGIVSNYDGVHLGDAAYAPVFTELNRRSAVVYVHAAAPEACRSLIPGLAPHALEFPFDTARTIASLVISGSFARWPDLRFVFSHGAGALPMVAYRLEAFLARMPDAGNLLQEGALVHPERIFVDTASVTNPPAMAALRQLLPPTQIMFGSDYPFFTPALQLSALRGLGIPDDEAFQIESGNARRLFPRL